MYKIMQKYNKKFLAIVMVFLMIAFVIPQFSKSPTPGTVPAGTMGNETISIQDVRNGTGFWQMLTGRQLPAVVVQRFNRQTQRSELQPLADELGTTVVNEISNHPVMFVLLQREAEKDGVSVSDTDLEALLGEIQIHLPDGRNVLYENERGTETGDLVRDAVHSYMLITNSFEQAASIIKVSQPLLQNRMAKALQELKLNLVAFNSKDYVDKVEPPTPQQVNEQFNKYGDVLAGQVDPKTNPFGFGYKYPDRVKVSFIGVSLDEVKHSIRSSKSDYDWEVDAEKYYKQHPAEFATTQPTSQPASRPTTLPSGATASAATTAPASRPTTQPFAEVHDKIVEELIAPEATRLESQIESRITTQMREDWNVYHNAVGNTSTTAPTTVPAPKTSLGVAFNSQEYLPKLGEEIQKQFKVVPTVQVLADKFRDANQLAELPGIGPTFAIFGQQIRPFPLYATQMAAPFAKNSTAQLPAPPIQLFEPSRPLLQSSGIPNDTEPAAFYIFRLIDVDPAHKPADAREVLQQVEEDIRKEKSYELAKADAQALVEKAQSTSLSAAAANAKKTVMTPDYIRYQEDLPKELGVSDASKQEFMDQAFALLTDAALHKSTTQVIGLPRDGLAFVAQLADVRREPILADLPLEGELASEIRTGLARGLYQQWYNFDSVVERLHYVDASKKKESEG